MSPAIHNAAFDAADHDGVYLPFLVQPEYESFKAFMENFLHFEKLDLAGLSITIPHKEHALKYLLDTGAKVEPLAQSIGAVNTIAIEKGKLTGSNTDFAAILECICRAAGIDRAGLSALRVGVIGAGGTGRTAVASLAHFGATVLVCNRTAERAKHLAAEFDGRTGKVSPVSLQELDGCDVWINCSSVGMHPNVDGNPLGDFTPKWTSQTVVFDAVYNPMRTKFLQQAEAAGAKTISGVEMFVHQAAAQFETWTGKARAARRDAGSRDEALGRSLNGFLRRDGNHNNTFRRGRAILLANPAANTPKGFHRDAVIFQFDGRRPQRAMIHADPATIPRRSQARLLPPNRRPHVDVVDAGRFQRAAGADLHALESRANRARRGIRHNVRQSESLSARRIDFDRLHGARLHAVAMARARGGQMRFVQRPRRAQPDIGRDSRPRRGR